MSAPTIIVPGLVAGSPRNLLADTCQSATPPAGVTTSGQYVLDGTNQRTLLGGTSGSTYVFSATLSGAITVEVLHENVGTLANGTFFIDLSIGATHIHQLAYQNDANVVPYDYSGSSQNSWGSNQSRDYLHAVWRSIISLTAAGEVYVVTQRPYGPVDSAGGGGPQNGARANNDTQHYAGQATNHASVAAGDTVTVTLSTATTRQVALYGVKCSAGVDFGG